jgi:hypothetical protein
MSDLQLAVAARLCVYEREPCPLRVSCPGADRAERAVELQALAFRFVFGLRQSRKHVNPSANRTWRLSGKGFSDELSQHTIVPRWSSKALP